MVPHAPPHSPYSAQEVNHLTLLWFLFNTPSEHSKQSIVMEQEAQLTGQRFNNKFQAKTTLESHYFLLRIAKQLN